MHFEPEMLFFLLFLNNINTNSPKIQFLLLFQNKTYINTMKMLHSFDICMNFQQIPAHTAGTLCVTHKGGTKTLRTSFSTTVELFLIEGSRLFIIFDFQQLLFLTNFDQTHRYRDRTITSHQCSRFTTCSLSHRHRADGNFEDEFLHNR